MEFPASRESSQIVINELGHFDLNFPMNLGYYFSVSCAHRTYGSSNSNWYVKFQMLMSARAFWRISYFAVFFTEYKLFMVLSYGGIYFFQYPSEGSLIINFYSVFIVLFRCLVTKTIRQSTDGRMSFDKGNYGRPIRNDPDQHFMIRVSYRRTKTLLCCAIVSIWFNLHR